MAKNASSTVKARVLMDCPYGKADDVVEVSAEEAKANPALDAHPDAVAYAEGRKKASEADAA